MSTVLAMIVVGVACLAVAGFVVWAFMAARLLFERQLGEQASASEAAGNAEEEK